MKKSIAAIIALAVMLLGPAGALAKTFTVDVGPPGRLPAHLDLSAFSPRRSRFTRATLCASRSWAFTPSRTYRRGWRRRR